MKASIDVMKWLLRCGALALGGALIAKATVMTLGTKWTIANDTDAHVTIACERLEKHDEGDVKLMPTEVPPREALEYNWGGALSNNGMGLAGGLWVCHVADKPGTEIGRFKTDKGEYVRLVVKKADGLLSVAKLDGPSKMALGHGEGQKELK